jgi:hypothetical protein
MAEQTLEIRAVSGLTNVTMFVKNIDTVEDIATGLVTGAVVAGSTVYRHTFEDLVAATRLVGLRNADGVIADTLITIGAATGVYRATSNADLKTQIAGIDAGSGSGARTITITVTDGTDPLQNARVRLTEGANTFTALTNVSGVVTLNGDDATYTVAITKASHSFAGASLVVSGDTVQTYAMTLVSVAPPADAASSTGVAIVYDENEIPEASVPVYFRKYVSGGPGTAGYIEDYAVKTLTSDASGNIEGQFRRLWTYEVWRGDGTIKRRFTVPDAESFSIAEALGADL